MFMTADAAQINLAAIDPIDFDNYEEGGGKGFVIPEPGRYVGRAPIFPMSDDPDVFGHTQEGKLKIAISPIAIVGGEHDGVEVRYSTLSAKKYSNRNGNQIVDFVRACGLDLRPQTEEDYKNAVRQCSGRTFQFGLDWEAKNKSTSARTRRQANFPDDPENVGKKLSYITDEYDTNKRYWAYPVVVYYVSALSK